MSQERYHDYMMRRMKEEDAKMIDKQKWDVRFYEMARLVSTWSKDPSSKIGAVIVNDERRILATGYNGFPRGISDSEDRLNSKEEKYPRIIHAEMNALMNALYNGVSIKDATLYVYGLPICGDCTKAVIQSGIKRVFIAYWPTDMPRQWKDSWNMISKPMLEEAGVEIDYLNKKVDRTQFT